MTGQPTGPRDRRSADQGHLLIGGTGRAGTTLLVRYFTALGFDTGFSAEDVAQRVDPISHGGLEHSLGRTVGRGGQLPYVAKSPYFGEHLGEYLERGELRVRCFILPMRDLFDAAESRRNVSRRAALAGKDPDRHPGGVIKAKQRRGQEQKLAVQFYTLLHGLVSHDVPVRFLRFPEFATGEQSLFEALEPLLVEHGVTRDESESALAGVVDPKLISALGRTPEPDS